MCAASNSTPDDADSALPERWFTRIRGSIRGPFRIEELKTQQARGQLSRFHEVSTDQQEWKPASSLAELFESRITPPPVVRSSRDTPMQVDPAGELPADTGRPVEPPPTPATSHPPSDGWFYSRRGARQGPVPHATIADLLASGTLRGRDRVWRDGWPDWVAVRKTQEFRDSLPRRNVLRTLLFFVAAVATSVVVLSLIWWTAVRLAG